MEITRAKTPTNCPGCDDLTDVWYWVDDNADAYDDCHKNCSNRVPLCAACADLKCEHCGALVHYDDYVEGYHSLCAMEVAA